MEYRAGKRKVARKRTEPYDALERREQKKEATRKQRSHKKHEQGENDIKEDKVEKGLRTSPLPHPHAPPHTHTQKRSEVKGTLKVIKDKTTKAQISMKDSLTKSPIQQNKNKQNHKKPRQRERTRTDTSLQK